VTPPGTVQLHRIRLPLVNAHVAAHGTEAVREVILVEWRRHDLVSGWGECPTLSEPGYSGETTDVAWAGLTGRGRLGPMAAGALADARLDAWLRAEGRSLADHLGARVTAVPTCHVIGLDRSIPPGESMIKLKVTPDHIDRLVETRAAWPSRPMAADANGSFRSPHELTRWLDDLGLEYLEQPFAAKNLAAHAALRVQVCTPIALDESVGSAGDLHAALDAGAIQVLSIKPARLGGVEAAATLLAQAADHGLETFVGGMLETGIGRATSVALAACEGVTHPTDLGPSSRYFDQDVCDPIELRDGRLPLPNGPGIGRVPDPDRLTELTVAWAELDAREGE